MVYERNAYDDESSSEDSWYFTGFLARPARGCISKLSSIKSSSEVIPFLLLFFEANMSSSESESSLRFFFGDEAFGLGFGAGLVAFGPAFAPSALGLGPGFDPVALAAGAFLGLAGPSALAAFPRPFSLGLNSSSSSLSK